MKKNIEISIEDAKFLADYKKSHGVLPTKFIDLAIKEKIIKTKAELKINGERITKFATELINIH